MAGEQHWHDIRNRGWKKIKPYTLGKKGYLAVLPGIPIKLSTAYFECCEQERPGGLYRQNTKTGKYTPPVLPMARQGNTGGNSGDFGWRHRRWGVMIDASHIKVSPDAADSRDRKQEMAAQSSSRYIMDYVITICRIVEWRIVLISCSPHKNGILWQMDSPPKYGGFSQQAVIGGENGLGLACGLLYHVRACLWKVRNNIFLYKVPT